MDQLTILNVNGGLAVDSREVAIKIEKEHKNLLRDIKGYYGILLSSNLSPANFFIEDSYQDSTGRTLPCYLLTKKGCDMVANKMTGKKGVLFTAEYVTAFEEMKDKLKQEIPKLSKELQAIFVLDERTVQLENEVHDLKHNSPLFNIECDEFQNVLKQRVIKLMGGKPSKAYSNRSLRARVFADIQKEVKRQFGLRSYKAIKRGNLEKAFLIIEQYKLPYILEDEITLLNNQISM